MTHLGQQFEFLDLWIEARFLPCIVACGYLAVKLIRKRQGKGQGMTIPQLLIVGLALLLGGLWLSSRSRQHQRGLDPRLGLSHLAPERRASFTQLLLHVVLVLVVLVVVWLLIEAQFGGLVLHISLSGK